MTDRERRAADQEADYETDGPGDDEKPLGRDDRISFWPLSFEEVVRTVHRAGRPPEKKLPKRRADSEPADG